MNRLHITLFGKFDASYGNRILEGLATRKVQQLFCYVLLHRDRPHPREALADLLWGDCHIDRPSRCLRKTLWQLRAALDSPGETLSDRVLLVDPWWVQLDPEADLWLDVAVFEQAFNRVQGLEAHELDSQDVQTLQNAVDLYRGGLQESWYQDWYLYERERFQHMYLIMLDKLMGSCEARRDYAAGLVYGTRILRCERAHERTHRRMMRLHCLAGDRTAALRQYERCIRALDEELDVKPVRRTVALYETIRACQPSALAQIPVETKKQCETVASLFPGLLGRLGQLQALLAQVLQDIQAVELLINGQD